MADRKYKGNSLLKPQAEAGKYKREVLDGRF